MEPFLRGKSDNSYAKCRIATCGKIISCGAGSTSGMHTHMKSVHRMPLLKRVAIDDAAGSKIEPKKSIGSYQISDYFLTNIDNSLPAVIS